MLKPRYNILSIPASQKIFLVGSLWTNEKRKSSRFLLKIVLITINEGDILNLQVEFDMITNFLHEDEPSKKQSTKTNRQKKGRSESENR
jgi:hypothetical protein